MPWDGRVVLIVQALLYHDKPSFLQQLAFCADREALQAADWNAYREFAPAPVMRRFFDVFLKCNHAKPESLREGGSKAPDTGQNADLYAKALKVREK